MTTIILPPKTATSEIRQHLARGLKRKGKRGQWVKGWCDTFGADDATNKPARVLRKALRMGRLWDVALGNAEIVERIERTIAETADERKARHLALYAERFANGLTIFEGAPLPSYMANVTEDLLTEDTTPDTIS